MAEEKKGFFGAVKGFLSQDDDIDESYEEEVSEPIVTKTSSTSSKKESKTAKVDEIKNINIKTIKPGDDKGAVATILDSLKNNQVVIVNYEDTRPDIRASFSDAFFGATYVLDAKYTKISETTYSLAPKNVSVSPLIAGMADSSSDDEANHKKEYFDKF